MGENLLFQEDKPVALPIDIFGIDVLCTNCYETIKFEEVDEHSAMCLPGHKGDQTYTTQGGRGTHVRRETYTTEQMIAFDQDTGQYYFNPS